MRKGQKEHKDDEVHAELEHEVCSQVLFCFCFFCISFIFYILYVVYITIQFGEYFFYFLTVLCMEL